MPPEGVVWTGLSSEPLDVEAVHRFLTTPDAGGTCVFVGTTRQWTGNVESVCLRYEAYHGMAAAELQRLADETKRRWHLLRVVALHRVGDVPVAHPSVVVAAASPHRGPAFEATRHLLDTLKATVPIWKTDL